MSRDKFDLELILEAETLATNTAERLSEAERSSVDHEDRGIKSEKILRESRDRRIEINHAAPGGSPSANIEPRAAIPGCTGASATTRPTPCSTPACVRAPGAAFASCDVACPNPVHNCKAGTPGQHGCGQRARGAALP